jgi:hypothetical protein
MTASYERPMAFWFGSDGKAIEWTLVRVVKGDGSAICDACGQRDLVWECYVDATGRPRRMVGSVCVSKVAKLDPRFGALNQAVGHEILHIEHLCNRQKVAEMLPTLTDHSGLRNLIEAHLWSVRLGAPRRSLLKLINSSLSAIGLPPLPPLGAFSEHVPSR